MMSISIPAVLAFQYPHWIYIANCIPNPDDIFDLLMEQVKNMVASYMVSSAYQPDKMYPSKRLSCVFSKEKRDSAYGDSIPTYNWEDSSIVSGIKAWVEDILTFLIRLEDPNAPEIKFDYALLHLYRTGDDTISWHSDREGRTSHIASVSLGATRKFRFRRMGETKGFEEEYELESGACVIMKPSCQHNYLHCVPVEKRVKEPRLNITFRMNK